MASEKVKKMILNDPDRGSRVSDEKYFIDNLGTFTQPYRRSPLSREQLLKNYIEGLKTTTSWDEKSRKELLMYTNEVLLREQGKIL